MNDGLEARAGLVALASICREAASRHGDNWPAIESHIKQCVGALPEGERKHLASEIDRVLRYCAPGGDAPTQ